MCVCGSVFSYVFFFFQAEDGIRDIGVTGVQTCALPIFSVDLDDLGHARLIALERDDAGDLDRLEGAVVQIGLDARQRMDRSEERRVGKECRSRWSTY